ncbi:MAG TPA: glycosyltransferase family 1 protein [Thermoanaerobaculia bacterium]|jgi:alpha-1,3-rhamnosyl/mannosyltransferase
MRVAIDGRALVGHRTGIGVHTAEIARRLPCEVTIASHAEIADREGLEGARFAVDPMPLGVLWQQLRLPRIDADVLWAPHGTLPMTWKRPSVVTLHDFTSITMPGRHRLQTILSFNLFIGRSLELATRVACVSRQVADEAMRGFGVDAHKIELVPNGVDPFFSPDDAGEADYVLYAGTLEPRKGIDLLVAAWRALPEPRPRLVLCGDAGWKTRLPDDPRIELTGYVTRERLRALYRGARAFVYPSRYEGFGIPPLEAMACGAPVIATRTGAIPELAGDAALLVPPGDGEALRAALARLLRDGALRADLRARGPERAHLWRWERSAETMAELLGCA